MKRFTCFLSHAECPNHNAIFRHLRPHLSVLTLTNFLNFRSAGKRTATEKFSSIAFSLKSYNYIPRSYLTKQNSKILFSIPTETFQLFLVPCRVSESQRHFPSSPAALVRLNVNKLPQFSKCRKTNSHRKIQLHSFQPQKL